MNKKGSGAIVIVMVLAIVLIWGFVGGQQAQSPGVTCDMGMGDIFCWQWHTNLLGQAQEFVGDTGNAIKDLFK